MNILNLVSLVLGFIGSLLLSLGLLRPEGQVIDESLPYWDENPFQMRSALAGRRLALWGFVLVISGFAIALASEAVKLTGAHDQLSLSLALSLAFMALGWLAMAIALQRMAHSHKRRRFDHYQGVLKTQLRALIAQSQKMITIQASSETWSSDKQMFIEQLLKCLPDLPRATQKNIDKLVEQLKQATTFEDGKKALELSLNDLTTGAHR